MARLLPNFVSEDCKSNAERRLFERFRIELPEDYTVLHSLGVAQHRYKLYSEADFVVIHRRGVVIFEVKGGRVARKDGIWYFTDRYGNMGKRRESPMQQAASVAAAIRKSVAERFGLRSPQAATAFGGVAFLPDIDLDLESVEWDRQRVYDKEAWPRPLLEVVEDAVSFTRAQMLEKTGYEPHDLDAVSEAALLEYLRGNFEKVPTLAAIIEGHEHEMVRLAAQQYALLDHIARNPRIVVEGQAGTGKTLIAMECARRHAAEGRRVLFVCFNRLLADHLDSYATRNRSSVNVSINTLHGHCLSVLREAGKSSVCEFVGREGFSEEIPRLVQEAAAGRPGLRRWDVLIVDEGQDIGDHAPFARALGCMLEGGYESGRWMWFEDPRQRIIRQGASPFDIQSFLPFNFTLTRNWRNTNEVVTFFSVASMIPRPQFSGIRGQQVRKVVCSDCDGLRRLAELVTEIRDAGVTPEQVVLLTAAGEKAALFARTSSISGLRLVPYDPRQPARAGQLRHSSIFRFKGLEAKVIILTDIEDLDAENSRMEAYVGMSRANSALYTIFSSTADAHFEANRLVFGDLDGGI